MHKRLYFDGNAKGIAWIINTNTKVLKQHRIHPNIYLNQLEDLQSKYVALHIGVFWGIGTFVIKDIENLEIMIHSKIMYRQLTRGSKVDSFIEKRLEFITRLIQQRKLNIIYKYTEQKNPATKLLELI